VPAWRLDQAERERTWALVSARAERISIRTRSAPVEPRDSASTLYVGDARDVLADMPDTWADCIVTSPPYWGKRDYGVARQYGREPDPQAYIATL
jgi:DNA modification methylase